MDMKQFKAVTNRFALNNQAKKIFNKDFKFEHMVPKKFILRHFCGSKTPEEFETILRKNLSHAFIVSAVYDVLAARIRALRSKDQGWQNVAEVLCGNERSD